VNVFFLLLLLFCFLFCFFLPYQFKLIFLLARLRLRIDCKAITGSGTQGGATGIEVTPQESQAVVQKAAVVPITSNQPQPLATPSTGKASKRKLALGNGDVPSAQEVLNVIAFECFQTVDPSKQEELNGYVKYLKEVRKVLLIDAQPGSLIITVECRTLQILDELWQDYCTGHLNEMAQQFLVSEDILKAFGITMVKLTTTIVEEEYRACREYFLRFQGRYMRIK